MKTVMRMVIIFLKSDDENEKPDVDDDDENEKPDIASQ